jgi:hypothetical protein
MNLLFSATSFGFLEPSSDTALCICMHVCMYYVYIYIHIYIYTYTHRSGVVVKALRYKSAGRRFDSRLCLEF